MLDWFLNWVCFRPSVWVNVNLMGGMRHQPVSARAWVEDWTKTERVLNFLCWPYESDHCRKAHIRFIAAKIT